MTVSGLTTAILAHKLDKAREKARRWIEMLRKGVDPQADEEQQKRQQLRRRKTPNSIGAPLFFFTTREELHAADPLTHEWSDGNCRAIRLI
jgi:hypothetical protein